MRTVKAIAASILAVAGCILLYGALLRALQYIFQALPIPWGSVLLYGLGCAAVLAAARWLWPRWRLAFGAAAVLVGSISLLLLQALRDSARLYPGIGDRCLHSETTAQSILGVLFLAIGGVAYYYELLKRK